MRGAEDKSLDRLVHSASKAPIDVKTFVIQADRILGAI